ncbi:LegC family aminotransferase [Occallatibacter savannae]|uniref:LegC family aminotransferase n=1 Tax=Occallatibacter savannae TaxID=1002691 RepID=UPI000D69DF4A|nr:LegC family aminotransferase [Occallatibacter savannae]
MKTVEAEPKAAEPGLEFVPLSVPEIKGNEWEYVKECLDTGWVSSVGSYVERFEQMVASQAGTKYAVATVNGTSALHISLLVAGVQPEDEVLVSTLTFIAPVNAIRYAGAWPVFIDAEPNYWQMDPERVAHFLEQECKWGNGELRNRKTGRRVSAIIPVHGLGHPADVEPIIAVARKYGLKVIEDSTEALGAAYRGKSPGSWGDIGTFSFNGNKIITTGGGGMIVTDREDWAKKAKYLTTQAKDDPIEYIHGEVGYNYRLVNVLAAIGCAQMELLESYVAKKRSIAARYARGLADVSGLTLMREAAWAESTYWMYTVLVEPGAFGMSSRKLLKALESQKIQTRPLWQPIHLSPAHKGAQQLSLPVAEHLADHALSLPCSISLSESAQDRVIAAIAAAANSGSH